jgi:hypothetical protein
MKVLDLPDSDVLPTVAKSIEPVSGGRWRIDWQRTRRGA